MTVLGRVNPGRKDAMTKVEMKTADDSQIIVDYIKSYSLFCTNDCLSRGTKAVCKHLKDLDAEMLKRGILSQDQINYLNA